jgi:hypothetical protein
LALGNRDVRTGNYEVRSGVGVGDMIMRNPTSSLKEGQTVEMATTKAVFAGVTLAQGS